MKASKLALIILCLMLSSTALACSPAPLGITEARRADAAFVGEATRLQWVKPKFDLFVYVTPIETLKGTPASSVKALSPCGSPIEVGQRVIVAELRGQFYVYPANEYERRFREALRYRR